jgi:hypothetical protein
MEVSQQNLVHFWRPLDGYPPMLLEQCRNLSPTNISLLLVHSRHDYSSLEIHTLLETRVSGEASVGRSRRFIDVSIYTPGNTGEYLFLPTIEGFRLGIPDKHNRLAAYLCARAMLFVNNFEGVDITISSEFRDFKKNIPLKSLIEAAGSAPPGNVNPEYV